MIDITTHTTSVEILKYLATGEIDTIPDIETMVLVADHGLDVGDFFINKTARDLSGIYNTERGSRKVFLAPTTKEIGYHNDISTATAGDEILLYKFTDITEYLSAKTLTITKKASHSNTASFRLFLPIVADVVPFKPHPGQLIRIKLDDEIRFMGMISDISATGLNDVHPYLYMDIQCIGLKSIAARRTVTVNYAATEKAGDIVAALNDSVLVPEGFSKALPAMTYIDEGDEIGEPWANDCITVADIFDELAARNGFQWFVDDDFQLHFYQDPAVIDDAPYNVDATGEMRYRGITLSHSIDNYVNKNFVIGGKDADGNQIRTVNLSLEQQNYIQEIICGTGVWGNVLRDSGISNVLYRSAEAGTGTYTIVITGHGMSVGDYVYNSTLGQIFWVASIINANSFMVNETAYDQAVADLIITYPSADNASLNIIKKQGFMPKIVSYTIDHIFLEPQMKQTINLPRLGIVSGTYVIDSVTIKSLGAGFYESSITAILRDADNLSTHGIPTYTDFLRGF